MKCGRGPRIRLTTDGIHLFSPTLPCLGNYVLYVSNDFLLLAIFESRRLQLLKISLGILCRYEARRPSIHRPALDVHPSYDAFIDSAHCHAEDSRGIHDSSLCKI